MVTETLLAKAKADNSAYRWLSRGRVAKIVPGKSFNLWKGKEGIIRLKELSD